MSQTPRLLSPDAHPAPHSGFLLSNLSSARPPTPPHMSRWPDPTNHIQREERAHPTQVPRDGGSREGGAALVGASRELGTDREGQAWRPHCKSSPGSPCLIVTTVMGMGTSLCCTGNIQVFINCRALCAALQRKAPGTSDPLPGVVYIWDQRRLCPAVRHLQL